MGIFKTKWLGWLPGPTSGPAFWLMMLSWAVVIPVIAGVLLAAMFMTMHHVWWFYAAIGVVLGLGAIALFVTGLGLAVYLTLSKQWHVFAGWWLDRLSRLKDRFLSIRSSLRLARKTYGASHPGPERDAKDASSAAGFLLGMAPPQRFPKRETEKLTFEDDRHVTMIAGSRAGKGRSFIIPNLAHWQGSVIVYDPSGENYRETAAYRRKVLGQRTILLDPFGVTGETSDYWNPMAEVDFESDANAIDKCHMLAESLHAESGGDPYWMHAPRKLLAMLIAYVGTRALPDHMNLAQVRDLLMTSDPSALWVAMSRSEAFGGLVRRFAESNEHRHAEELASTMEIARTAMKWLDSGVMSQFTGRSSFKMRELKEGKASVYIVLPAGMGESYKSWLRLLFNAAFDAMQDTQIPKPDHATLFLMDEFPLLGKMDRIKRAAGEAAKFGVKLFICAQDIGQLKENYGHQAWETFIANSGLLIMFANNDLETQQYLSARLGKEYYKSYSSGGGQSSYTMQLRDVARPDQAEKLVSRQSGTAFLFIQGEKPMRLPRANYDEWSMLAMSESKDTDLKAANDPIPPANDDAEEPQAKAAATK